MDSDVNLTSPKKEDREPAGFRSETVPPSPMMVERQVPEPQSVLKESLRVRSETGSFEVGKTKRVSMNRYCATAPRKIAAIALMVISLFPPFYHLKTHSLHFLISHSQLSIHLVSVLSYLSSLLLLYFHFNAFSLNADSFFFHSLSFHTLSFIIHYFAK